MTELTAIDKAQDSIQMLKLVQNATHNQINTKHMTIRYLERYTELFTFVKGQNMTHNDYYTQFRGLSESIWLHGRAPWQQEEIVCTHAVDIATRQKANNQNVNSNL